jgi:predicted O-methyltransferase YrrM
LKTAQIALSREQNVSVTKLVGRQIQNMNRTADNVLTEIENGPDAFMIIGREKGKVLTDLIKKHNAKNILEIGTNLGFSSIFMAMHLSPDGKITTLEMQEKSAARAQASIDQAGLTDKIQIIVGKAQQTIPTLSEKYDFVFIDAAKAEYLDYLKLVEEKLSPSAVIIADNVKIFKEEIQEYLDYVKAKYNSKTIEVGTDAMEISKKV